MVVSCGMPAGGPLWWQARPDSSVLPWALAIEADPDSWQARLSGWESDVVGDRIWCQKPCRSKKTSIRNECPQ